MYVYSARATQKYQCVLCVAQKKNILCWTNIQYRSHSEPPLFFFFLLFPFRERKFTGISTGCIYIYIYTLYFSLQEEKRKGLAVRSTLNVAQHSFLPSYAQRAFFLPLLLLLLLAADCCTQIGLWAADYQGFGGVIVSVIFFW